MTAVYSAVVSATVALLVAFLGHWQWRRQQATTASARFTDKRADALVSLWEKIGVNSALARAESLRPSQFYEAMQDLNFFLIEKSPFLTDAEKGLARDYLSAVYSLRAKVDESRDEAARWAMTLTNAETEVGELADALDVGVRAETLAKELGEHIKKVLSGRPSRVDPEEVEKKVARATSEARRASPVAGAPQPMRSVPAVAETSAPWGGAEPDLAGPDPSFCLYCGGKRDGSHGDHPCESCGRPRPRVGTYATMRECSTCGDWTPALARFCEWCGAKFDRSEDGSGAA
jgi:hypothetical protein